ncbi:MAG: RDD family protein [Thermoleophilia bacterium]|nr:RDD family protein [Thermoleophilia bacterium]MDH3725086.1 RDD family protein [Thermoleophilia bacterium]
MRTAIGTQTSTNPNEPPLHLPPGVQLSSKGKRFGAYLLDIVLFIVTLVIGWIIWSLIVWARGQTPGKQLIGMYTFTPRNAALTGYGDMVVREFVLLGVLNNLTFGLFEFVGAFWIFSGEQNRTVWDRMMKTVIVDDPNQVLLTQKRAKATP